MARRKQIVEPVFGVSSVAFLGIREGSGRVVWGAFGAPSARALSDVVGGQVAAGVGG